MSTVTTTTTTTALLPHEIIMNILSRLPASSLVSSFKLVCKPWCNLIKDPDFVKMHHLLHLHREEGGGGGASITSNSSLICKSGKDLFEHHPSYKFEGGLLPAATKLDFDSVSFNWRLVGSCNGLLLLCSSFKANETIMLLNPSTRKYKISPKQPLEYPTSRQYYTTRETIYGFGCCCYNNNIYDEYKVVRIVYFYGMVVAEYSSPYQFDIYYMSSNSWRRMDTKTMTRDYASISSEQSGVLVNEALHWVAASLDGLWDTIASFDIRDEEFRQVPIPYEEPYFNLDGVILMNMKGCLSIIRFSHANNNSMDDSDLEVWVMKEYGIKESWTKHFVISSGDNTDPPRPLSEFKISRRSNICVLKGDHILIEGLRYTKDGPRSSSHDDGVRKLVLYDINKRKINGDFEMIGVPHEPDQADHIETLVSLKSGIMAVV